MKWLKVVGLAIALWGLGLIWLEFRLILLSPVMLGIVAIVAIGLPAYRLGCFVGQRYRVVPTKIVHPTSSLQSNSPVFARHHHSRSTHPMPVIQPPRLHSHPTRPMPATN